MKKLLSLVLALLMVLGCMSITAFAEEPGNSTTIKATKTLDLSYEMVIPGTTELNKTNYKDVVLDGKATVANVKDASYGTRIYYTVDMTNANFTDGNEHTMAATYQYAQGGDYVTLDKDTTVTVFDGNKINDSTISVTVSDDEWKKAAPAEYTATLVFAFDDKEVTTVGDLLGTVKTPGFPAELSMDNMWVASDEYGTYAIYTGTFQSMDCVMLYNGSYEEPIAPLYYEVEKIKDSENYSMKDGSLTITFNMTSGHLTSIHAKAGSVIDLTFAPLETKPISEILALSEETFPTSLTDAWRDSIGGICCFVEDDALQIYSTLSGEVIDSISLTTAVPGFNNIYSTKSPTMNASIRFTVESGKLTSIKYMDDWTVKPKVMTIATLVADVWTTDCPTSSAPWLSEKSSLLYIDGSNLILAGDQIPTTTELTKDGDNYKYVTPGVTITFVISQGKVTSVEVTAQTTGLDKYVGTYQKRMNGNDIIREYANSLPKGSDDNDYWNNGTDGNYIWYSTSDQMLWSKFSELNAFALNFSSYAVTETQYGYSLAKDDIEVKIYISDNQITQIELVNYIGYTNNQNEGNGTYRAYK